MSLVLAAICVANCWVIPKLWWPARLPDDEPPPTPPRGGIARIGAAAGKWPKRIGPPAALRLAA